MVTRIRALLGFYLPRKIRVEHGASVLHLDPGRGWQITYGIGRSQRVLDRSQVREYANLETAFLTPWGRGGALRRLVDHAHFSPRAFGDGFDAERLQDHDPGCLLQRTNRFRAVLQVAIQIRASQSDNDRSVRTPLAEPLNGRKAAPRV